MKKTKKEERKMMRKSRWIIVSMQVFFVFVGFAITLQAASPARAESKIIKWKGQSSWNLAPPSGWFKPNTGPAVSGAVWVKWVKEATNGRLLIDLLPPGSLVPVSEQFSAVKKGVFQVVAPTTAGYYAGQMPEGYVEQGMPFSIQTVEEGWDWLYKFGMYDEFVKIYAKHNLFPIIFCGGTMANFGAKFPLDKPDALRGKKIRATGSIGEYVKMLGASPVQMPFTDIYMGLKLGTIDAYQGAVGALGSGHLDEVTKHFLVYPNITTFTNTILINMDAFKALPDDIREIITRDSKHVLHTWAMTFWQEQEWAIANMKNVQVDRWSDKDAKIITKKAIETVWPWVAQISPNNARLVEMTKNWAKAYGKQ
jgi:TRAP-type C4-dicarboxylate transport system substrate-binding protein